MSTYLLTILIFLPLLAGFGILAIPEARAQQAKIAAIAVAVLTLLLSISAWAQLKAEGGMQLAQKWLWLPSMGIEFSVGIDGISLFLVLLGALFTLLAMFYGWQQITRSAGRFYGLLLIFEAGVMGTLLSLNLFQFYLFWELMLIPMYFLVGIWGGENRIRAVTRFVIFTMAGSLVLLLSILYLGVQHQAATGTWSLDIATLAQLKMPQTPLVDLLFFGFALAFLIKIPVFPLHTWLPDTYTEAPPVVTFLLSGVMAKMGVYGFIRIPGTLFADSLERWAPVLSALAVIGILYGALLALGQDEIKRLLAYSSVSHLGLIALGVFSWNVTSLEGVVYHMINHAVATGALFLLAGLLEERGITRISQLTGLAAKAPLYTVLFLLMTFASIGVPGLNGFIGEFTILLGVSARSATMTLLAALTLILSAGYMLWLTQRLLFGPAPDSALFSEEPLTLPAPRLAAVLPLAALAVIMGLYTQPFMSRITPAVQHNLSNQQTPVHAQVQEANHG